MCKYCEANSLSICFISKFEKHYGYCGGYSKMSVGDFAMKVRGSIPKKENGYEKFNYCPICGRKLEGKK